jgi:hypothetical protein
MPVTGKFKLSPRRPLSFLLKCMQEDDLPTGKEEVDHTVNVGVASLPELPQRSLQMTDQWFLRANVGEAKHFY